MKKSVLASIAEVQEAARLGRLSSYQASTKADDQVQQSWGPAMRR